MASNLLMYFTLLRRGWRHQNLSEAWQGSAGATGPAVLHDMSVAVAEAVALAYLAEARSGLAGGPAKQVTLQTELSDQTAISGV